MAYLPPAGIRQLTAHKMTYMPTMSEVPNPLYFERVKHKPAKNSGWRFDESELKNRDEDWPPIPKRFCPTFSLYDDGCSARCQCVRPPIQLGENASHLGKPTKDPRELPHGLPPMTFDCKRRANWFDNWKEHNAKYSGSFALWQQQYGDQYFYTDARSKAHEENQFNVDLFRCFKL